MFHIKTTKNLEHSRGNIHYAWVVLVIATISQVSISFISLGIATLVPFLIRDFGISRAQVGFLLGAINIGTALTALLVGILVDRLGEKKVLIVGGLLTGLSILMSSIVNSFVAFALLLMVVGYGAASTTTAGSKGILFWFPERWRGFALGFRQIGQPLGTSLAAVILPALALTYGWRGALVGASISAFVGVLLVLVFYREKNVETSLLKDPVSLKQGLPKLLHNKDLWLVTFTAMILVGIQFSLMGYLELFIHEGIGYSIRFAGYMLALASITGMFSRIFWGIISDKVFGGKRKNPFLIVIVLTVVSCLSMYFLQIGSPWWIITTFTCLAGFSAMGWNGLYVAMVSELAGRDLAGTALGASLTVAQFGVLAIQPLFGFIVDQTGSYQFGWLMLMALAIAGIVFIGCVREEKDEAEIASFL